MSAPRAILYDRVSTVVQSTNYSGGKDGFQLDKCKARADAQGWPIVDQITDVDSGAKWEIDGLLEAVEKAKRGEYEKLVVYETSRFARDVGKKAVYEAALKRHGVQVVYLNVPEGDSPETQLMSDFLGAFAAYEREQIRRRVMSGIQQKARGGRVVGAGVAPYGYEYVTAWSDVKRKPVPIGLQAHPERAAIAERIFRAATTTTLADLAGELTREGIPTPTGRGLRWTPATLSQMLQNRAYIGEWSYGGIIVPVPPLLDRALFDEARARLAERKVARRGRMPAAEDTYLLRGMLRCGHCGGLLSTWKASRWPTEAGGPRQKTTSYLCLRHKPGRAARAGVDVCPLPMLPAAIDGDRSDPTRRMGIEDAARAWVHRNVYSPRALRDLLERYDELYGELQRTRERQIADLDAKIAHHERRLARAVEEQLDVQRGSAKYEILVRSERQDGELLVQLAASRASLLAVPSPMPGVASRERLKAVIEEYTADIDDDEARPERLRELYRWLTLRGTVTLDPAGPFRLGSHRYAVAWSVLVTGESDKLTSESWTLFSSDGCTLTGVLAGIATPWQTVSRTPTPPTIEQTF